MKTLFFTLVLWSTNAFAYIPEYWLIASKMAEQHGHGGYWIEQLVTYSRGTETLQVKETWQVLDENHMRVALEGRGALKGLVQGIAIYDSGKKIFRESGSAPRTQRLGEDWLEPLLHFRSGKFLRQRLSQLKVTPPEATNDRPPLKTEGAPNYEPPGFIRLSRVGGAVTWAIGAPPSVGVAPTIWVEQDQFVIRKLKTASQVNFKADDYNKYSESFWYPGQQSYEFGPTVVKIQTLSVKPLGKISATDARFQAKSLSGSEHDLKIPDVDGLRDFYNRFR